MKARKPPLLRAGDTIAVVAPSAPLLSSMWGKYERGKQTLRDLGFWIVEGRTVGPVHGWSSGTPQNVANDINATFADPEVKAIIALAGGQSGISVLSHLNYDVIRAHPKPFLGFSDLTLFHLVFYGQCGMVGFHADNLIDGPGDQWLALDDARFVYLRGVYYHLLTKNRPIGKIVPSRLWECWRTGQASGPLIGGCLKRITALAATPFFPPLATFDGAILFWEEIGREVWDLAIDLFILKHMGIFDRIAGMLIGKLTWINRSDGETSYLTVRQLVLEVTEDHDFPIMANMDFGHFMANVPMPIGITATFAAETSMFTLIESAVQEGRDDDLRSHWFTRARFRAAHGSRR